jgi:LysR family transcriptional regulator, glycine cleavage system transcriptional activator
MSRLPPLDALIALEATARLAGMTRAALELGITQSAVSHRLRRIERFMGVALLVRRNNGMAPTPAGELVLDRIADVFKDLGDLRAQCLAIAAPDRLRVGIGAALADNWLVRRLPDFAAKHPRITIELVVVENEAPERSADLDVRVLWVPASEARASSTQRALFREHVFPVCHPKLLPARFVPGDASVLSCVPLLHKHSPGQGEEWSWPAWFARLKLKGKPKEALRFTSIGSAIAAAMAGGGAVLARSILVHDALIDGRLVRLLPARHDRLSAKVHVVRWPARLDGDARVRAFASWLVTAAQDTGREAANGKRARAA